MKLAASYGSRRQIIPDRETIVTAETQQPADADRNDNRQSKCSRDQARDTDVRQRGALACRSLPNLVDMVTG